MLTKSPWLDNHIFNNEREVRVATTGSDESRTGENVKPTLVIDWPDTRSVRADWSKML